MKNLILNSVLSLFLLVGLGLTVIASDHPATDKDKKAACCKTAQEGVKAAGEDKPEAKTECGDKQKDKKPCCKDKKEKKEAQGCKDKKPACEGKKADPVAPPAN